MKLKDNKIISLAVVLKILYVLVLLSGVAVSVWLAESEEFDHVRAIEGDGEYILHPNPLIPRDSPDMLVAEDGKLFLFYIDEELINVYSTSGNYLHGFQFPDGKNGKSDMHYVDGLLFVDARGSGIYVFRDTELLQFEEQHYQNQEHTKLSAVFVEDNDSVDEGYTYIYVQDSNEIVRFNHDISETVLQFPERMYDPISFLIFLLLMWTAGWFLWRREKAT